jgi:alkylation response protein AidB-like acyl-CoA dehydrogenase
LLSNERDVAADLGGSFQIAERIRLALLERSDIVAQSQLATLEIRLTSLARAQRDASAAAERDPAHGGPSYLKLAGSELQQALLRLLIDVSAPDAPRDVVANDLNARKLSIYAGTNEVHRDLLARHLLGA